MNNKRWYKAFSICDAFLIACVIAASVLLSFNLAPNDILAPTARTLLVLSASLVSILLLIRCLLNLLIGSYASRGDSEKTQTPLLIAKIISVIGLILAIAILLIDIPNISFTISHYNTAGYATVQPFFARASYTICIIVLAGVNLVQIIAPRKGRNQPQYHTQ